MYILHVNWFYWLMYSYVAKPLFGLFSAKMKNFTVVDKESDLLQYFDREHLHVQPYEQNGEGGVNSLDNAEVIANNEGDGAASVGGGASASASEGKAAEEAEAKEGEMLR
jgi:hypothetical protein